MIKLIHLIHITLALVVGMLFLLFDSKGDELFFFPYSLQKLTTQNYVYYLGEYYYTILICSLLVMIKSNYKVFFTVLLGLKIFDLIDYLLTFNSAWFYYHSIPITTNVISILILTSAIIINYLWTKPTIIMN